MAREERRVSCYRAGMAWLQEHLKLALGIVALAGLVASASAWIAKAEEEHRDARKVEELSKTNAEILQAVKAWIDRETAVREEREKIKRCLEENRGNEDRCL